MIGIRIVGLPDSASGVSETDSPTSAQINDLADIRRQKEAIENSDERSN